MTLTRCIYIIWATTNERIFSHVHFKYPGRFSHCTSTAYIFTTAFFAGSRIRTWYSFLPSGLYWKYPSCPNVAVYMRFQQIMKVKGLRNFCASRKPFGGLSQLEGLLHAFVFLSGVLFDSGLFVSVMFRFHILNNVMFASNIFAIGDVHSFTLVQALLKNV